MSKLWYTVHWPLWSPTIRIVQIFMSKLWYTVHVPVWSLTFLIVHLFMSKLWCHTRTTLVTNHSNRVFVHVETVILYTDDSSVWTLAQCFWLLYIKIQAHFCVFFFNPADGGSTCPTAREMAWRMLRHYPPLIVLAHVHYCALIPSRNIVRVCVIIDYHVTMYFC